MLLFTLHLAEELVDLLGLGDEGGGALQLGNRPVGGFGVGDLEQVVGEDDAGDVVEIAAVDGNTGEDVLFEGGGELLQSEAAVDGVDLGARGHDLADDLVAELDDGANELAIALLEDALFFPGLEQGVHGLGGMLLFGGVFGLGEGGDREQETEQEGDGKDQVEEGLHEEADTGDPHAAGAGEEDLGQEAVKDEDEEDQLGDGPGDLAEGRRDQRVVVEAQAGE